MAALSDFAEKLVLDWLMTTGGASRPTTWFVALFTAAPSDSGGGTEVPLTFNYGREAATFGAASSPGGTQTTTDAQVFTASGGSWGTITHMGIFDAVTSGNLLWHGILTASKVVGDGDTLTFAIGAIDLTLA